MRLTEAQLHFLATFARRPEWTELSRILDGLQADQLTSLRTASGEQVFRSQGALNVLQEFREKVESATATVNRSTRRLAMPSLELRE